MNILYCAPKPPEKKNIGSVGALRKINLTIKLLHDLKNRVVLLDSSHFNNSKGLFSKIKTEEEVIEGIKTNVVYPYSCLNRKIGKILQIILIKWIILQLHNKYRFNLILIYNNYLFESIIAMMFKKKLNIPYALQLEDLPWSRRRGIFNIKPTLEKLLFKKICENAKFILSVNETVLNEAKKFNQNIVLYPPLIDEKIIEKSNTRSIPFGSNKIKIGYFGGLNDEKGANIILKLMSRLNSNFEIHSSGKGPLVKEYNKKANEYKKRFFFYGFLNKEEYIEKLCEMDILINPHSDLIKMCNGVFPFKIYEYIATGAFVISTKFPGSYSSILNQLCIYDGSLDDLTKKILQSKEVFSHETQQKLRNKVIYTTNEQNILKNILLQLNR